MSQHSQSQSENSLPLVELFRHNSWANLRLLDACAGLNEQQLAATVDGVYGGIYDTLRHIIAAEQGYLNHLTGLSQGTPLWWEDKYPNIEGLRQYASHSGEGLVAAAAKVTSTDLVHLQWDDQHWPIPAGMILTQAITHATEHRAQIMTILTQLGIEPPDLSAWEFISKHVISTATE